MRIRALLVICTVGTMLADGARASIASAAVRVPDDAAYTVQLATGPGARVWRGTESIAFRNTGAAALDVIWVRLWANGLGGCRRPGITVTDVTGGVAGDPTVRCTAVPVTLDAPLDPNATTTIAMTIAIRPPAFNYRFGRANGVTRLGNALPILAVDDAEGWHLDPYTVGGESFYSMTSDWHVSLTVPPDLDTPATGALESTAPTSDGRVLRTYRADDVRDFAWMAGHFRTVARTDAHGTLVRVWYERGDIRPVTVRRLLGRAVLSMDTFSAAYGAYPYPEVDVVMLTSFAVFAGMEYPQLVMLIPNPIVISHELAHQWWFGIVGDDEYTEPWVDEGFATWAMFQPDRPIVGCAMFRWPNDRVRISSSMRYFDRHYDDYWVAYYQAACALGRLAKIFGLHRFVHILHDYAQDHWLGVTTTSDFQSAIEAAAAADGVAFRPATFWARWRIGPAPTASVAVSGGAGVTFDGSPAAATWRQLRGRGWG